MDNILIYKKIYNKIKAANNILLATHEKPDVDAASSVCAIIELLEILGKQYYAYCYDVIPSQFGFLPHTEKINSDKTKLNFSAFDLIITLDCGNISRTKLNEEIKKRNGSQFLIEIDHHLKTENHADLELRSPALSSTTEAVYEFFKASKIKINKNMANCILAGILTDSGNFIYQATSDKTIKISSEMLSRGANLTQIMENTLRNKNIGALKIWGKAISRLEVNEKYGIAFTALKLEDIEGIDEEDLEGIPNFLGNLGNAKAIMIIREQKDGTVKGSLRSAHPDINVARLAQKLGGGGHIKAAGFVIKGRLKQTKNRWEIV